ncbi:MAG TPA: hypothetical protein VJZ78_08385 [Anaerolineales bacterium]|nr:hypothetical protein [Anaerolineales bacterium]
MTRDELLKIVEQCSSDLDPYTGPLKIVRVPQYNTIFIEQNGNDTRSVMLSEQDVDGKTFWAGYSSYSETVYISQAS